MILTVDVGNSNTVWGLFSGEKLVGEWRYPTLAGKTPKIKSKVKLVVVASVVPQGDKKLAGQIRKHYSKQIIFVTAKDLPTIKIQLKKPQEIGADRLVDVFAAHKLFGGPLIIVDFGTATTFDVVTAKGAYLGGAIAPGITLARDSLYEKTAKLPKISIKAPKNVIGESTVEAIRSGLVFGYVAMVEGMITRLKAKLPRKTQVVATGGLAKLICKQTTVVDRIDLALTLKGLNMIGAKHV